MFRLLLPYMVLFALPLEAGELVLTSFHSRIFWEP